MAWGSRREEEGKERVSKERTRKEGRREGKKDDGGKEKERRKGSKSEEKKEKSNKLRERLCLSCSAYHFVSGLEAITEEWHLISVKLDKKIGIIGFLRYNEIISITRNKNS